MVLSSEEVNWVAGYRVWSWKEGTELEIFPIKLGESPLSNLRNEVVESDIEMEGGDVTSSCSERERELSRGMC